MFKYSLCIAFFSLFFFVLPVDAKLLPRYTNTTRGGSTPSSAVVVSPKLRGDRRALNIYFGNLSKAKGISYILTYQGSGSDQGAMGSVDSSGGNTSNRELLFGTCSSGVCTYHSNIVNAKLEVTIELTSGKKILRRYRINV